MIHITKTSQLKQALQNPFDGLEFLRLQLVAWFAWKADKVKPAHCQRELCWSMDQYQKYLQHIYTYGRAGIFIIYQTEEDNDSIYIVDGQHRIKAIRLFLSNKIPIFVCGHPFYYRDVKMLDQPDEAERFLLNKPVAELLKLKTETYDSELVEKYYHEFNFSGVPHIK